MGKKPESPSVLLARIDEKVKTLFTNVNDFCKRNDDDHKEIMGAIKELTQHVNHEIEELTTKVNRNTLDIHADKNKYKGRMELFKWVSVGLGIASTIISVTLLIINYIH